MGFLLLHFSPPNKACAVQSQHPCHPGTNPMEKEPPWQTQKVLACTQEWVQSTNQENFFPPVLFGSHKVHHSAADILEDLLLNFLLGYSNHFQSFQFGQVIILFFSLIHIFLSHTEIWVHRFLFHNKKDLYFAIVFQVASSRYTNPLTLISRNHFFLKIVHQYSIIISSYILNFSSFILMLD